MLLSSCGGGGFGLILSDGGNGKVYSPSIDVPPRETFQDKGSWVESCLSTLPESTYQNASLAEWAGLIYSGVNNARAQNGVPLLARSHGLDRIAQAQARDMALRHYFSHESPEGLMPWDRLLLAGLKDMSSVVELRNASDVAYNGVGENAAEGQESVDEVVNGWMGSSGHRHNLLNPIYTHVGTGVYYDPADLSMPVHVVQLYVQARTL
jgi:uncharacterized protein YkwD